MYTLLPSEAKAEEEADAEAARFAEVLGNLDEAGRERLARETHDFEVWQMQEEDENILQAVPRLSVRDIEAPEKRFSTKEENVCGIRTLQHPAALVDIGFYSLYYSLATLTEEEIMLLSLLTNVFTGLPTEGYSLIQLDDRIKSVMGDLDFDIVLYPDRTDDAVVRPFFRVQFGALKKNEADAFALVKEILTGTRFTGEACLDLLRMILFQCKESLQNSIAEEGDRFASMRAASHLSAAGALRERTEGVRMYEWVCGLAEMDEPALTDFAEKAAALTAKAFTPARLTASITAKVPAESAAVLAEVFGEEETRSRDSEQMRLQPDGDTTPELILIPGMTGYAARAGICGAGCPEYDGGRQVLAGILNYEYLWKEVRVRGGAYGCSIYMSPDGKAGFSSYRDPDPMHSLSVFEQTASFTTSFFSEEKDNETYIVGAAGAADPLLHARDKAARADADWFIGITAEERSSWHEQLLGADSDSLKEMAGYLTALKTCDCIIGGKELFAGQMPEGWKVTTL